jgi:ribonuclease-3
VTGPELAEPTLDTFEERLGVSFGDRGLLRRALVHRSLVNEAELSESDSNERLEFLGDAALGLVAAQTLYERYPDRAEGELSHARASLVNLKTLAEFARRVELGDHLRLGRGEDLSGGRSRDSVLGRAFEALLGAIYLDRGLEGLRGFLVPYLEGELERYGWAGPAKDYKSRLQEWLQSERGLTPAYELLSECGPDHAKRFRMAVKADGERLGEGEGSSKQRAEQAAARAALEAVKGSQGVLASD